MFMKISDQIRLRIESAISSGELLPGDAIDDVALATQHKVSRTPVREALLQLQAQGILSSTPRGGHIVSKMNLQQLLSLWELLAELEGVVVRLACERMTNDEIKALVKQHRNSQKLATKEDIDGWQEANLKFHEIIYEGARNSFLRQEVLRIRSRTGAYRRHAFGALGRIRSSYEQHEKIVNALEKRDAAAAFTCMTAHMRPGRDSKTLNDFIISLPRELLAG
jgi:DNA-binding GntR family transcriptional regulator